MNNGVDQLQFGPVVAKPQEALAVKITKRNTGLLDALHLRGFSLAETFGTNEADAVCNILEQNLFKIVKSATNKKEQTVGPGEHMSLRRPVQSSQSMMHKESPMAHWRRGGLHPHLQLTGGLGSEDPKLFRHSVVLFQPCCAGSHLLNSSRLCLF
jgi:hypothetical protein